MALGGGCSPGYLLVVLNCQTLVLNRSWMPIAITTVRRAVCLLATGVARAVNPKTYEEADWDGWIERGPTEAGAIAGVGFRFPRPEVIVLTQYNGFLDLPVAFTRRNVYRRDGYTCVYCGDSPAASALTIDHVIPRSRGGGTTWENCVAACHPCNARKADHLPEEIGFELDTKPGVPKWPGGIDPRSLAERSVWHRFLPAARRAAAARSASRRAAASG